MVGNSGGLTAGDLDDCWAENLVLSTAYKTVESKAYRTVASKAWQLDSIGVVEMDVVMELVMVDMMAGKMVSEKVDKMVDLWASLLADWMVAQMEHLMVLSKVLPMVDWRVETKVSKRAGEMDEITAVMKDDLLAADSVVRRVY